MTHSIRTLKGRSLTVIMSKPTGDSTFSTVKRPRRIDWKYGLDTKCHGGSRRMHLVRLETIGRWSEFIENHRSRWTSRTADGRGDLVLFSNESLDVALDPGQNDGSCHRRDRHTEIDQRRETVRHSTHQRSTEQSTGGKILRASMHLRNVFVVDSEANRRHERETRKWSISQGKRNKKKKSAYQQGLVLWLTVGTAIILSKRFFIFFSIWKRIFSGWGNFVT